MRLYFVLILTAISMAFVTGYIALFLQGSYTATDEDIIHITEMKQKFQKEISPVTIINFNSLYYGRDQFQLLDPVYVIPESSADADVVYYSSKNCFKGVNTFLLDDNYEKVWIWEEFRCGHRSFLPRSFFIDPPYIHPSGKSYVYLAYLLQKGGYQNKNWVTGHLPYLHATELKYIESDLGKLRGVFGILAHLNDDTLAEIAKGKGTVLTEKFLFAKLNYPRIFNILEYRIYSREDLDTFLKDSPFILHNYHKNRGCFYRDGSLCWDYNVGHIFKLANKSTILLFIGLIIIIVVVTRLLLVKIKLQRFEDERRRLALRVLTHEFRTPVTSLLLLTERLGKRYNELDESMQEIFLRLSSEVYRLQRLTETSRNYLKAEQSGKLIQFNNEKIPSVNMFVEEVLAGFLDKYGDKIKIEYLKDDGEYCLDTYWTGIIIKNLVDNAIQHGEFPIIVRLTRKKNCLIYEVEDQGSVQIESLEEMTNEFVKGNKSMGTGLGLNIVKKICEELGGRLELKKNPTIFSISIPNQKVEV